MALTYFRFLPRFLVVYIMHSKTGEDPASEGGYVHSDWRPKALKFPGLCVLRWSLALFLGAQKNGRELPLVFRVPGNKSICKSWGLLAKFSGLRLKYRGCVVLASLAVCVYKHSTCARTHAYSLIHSLRSLGGEKTLTTQTWPEKPVN